MLSDLMATSRRLGMGSRGQPLYAGEWKRSTHGLHLAAMKGLRSTVRGNTRYPASLQTSMSMVPS